MQNKNMHALMQNLRLYGCVSVTRCIVHCRSDAVLTQFHHFRLRGLHLCSPATTQVASTHRASVDRTFHQRSPYPPVLISAVFINRSDISLSAPVRRGPSFSPKRQDAADRWALLPLRKVEMSKHCPAWLNSSLTWERGLH